jgi:hypothetical protein
VTQRIVQFAVKKDCANIIEHLSHQKVDMSASLHLAVKYGSLEVARFFIAKGVPVDSINEEKQTPLMIAVENRHVEIVKLLLEKGASVRWVNVEELVMRERYMTTITYDMRAEAGGHEAVVRLIVEWIRKAKH